MAPLIPVLSMGCPVERLACTKVAYVESLVHAFAFSQSVPDNHRWVKMLVLSPDVVIMSHPLPHLFHQLRHLNSLTHL